MTPEFVTALEEWCLRGSRFFKFEFSTQDNEATVPKIKAWCYDFELSVGKFAYSISDIPYSSELKLIKKLELESAIAELGSLD